MDQVVLNSNNPTVQGAPTGKGSSTSSIEDQLLQSQIVIAFAELDKALTNQQAEAAKNDAEETDDLISKAQTTAQAQAAAGQAQAQGAPSEAAAATASATAGVGASSGVATNS